MKEAKRKKNFFFIFTSKLDKYYKLKNPLPLLKEELLLNFNSRKGLDYVKKNFKVNNYPKIGKNLRMNKDKGKWIWNTKNFKNYNNFKIKY